MNKCRTPNRNFCTPDGKSAALFCDIDGTTVVCQLYFDEAGENFAHYMQLRGFDYAEARAAATDFNRSFLASHGTERDVFPKALIECYRHLVKKSRRRFNSEQIKMDERIVHNIGLGPFFRSPELFPNAASALARAQHNFLIFAVTMGNREAQKHKIKQAGLEPLFDETIITSRDDKTKIVAQIMHDLNISPIHSAFIGNSPRSDGACLAVTNFIYLPLEESPLDKTQALPKSQFEVFEVADWRQAEEQGINRLLRRRKMAPDMESTPVTKPKHRCCKSDK
jgi:FMN phosphatase YigB (HAD superfamily)